MKEAPFRFSQEKSPAQSKPRDAFDEFEATELYCPNCSRAVPVNKFLLLVLPDGDRYEYRCKFCGAKVGEKTDHSGQFYSILK